MTDWTRLTLAGLALSLAALPAPSSAFSPAALVRLGSHRALREQPEPWTQGCGAAMSRLASIPAGRPARLLTKLQAGTPARTVPRMTMAEDAVSASNDRETLRQQVPDEPIQSGMVAPSESQLLEKLKGDIIPWAVTALLTVPFVVASRSMIPAIIVGVIDIAWFIYSYLQAKQMNTPAKPEPVSRDLIELWDKCLTESPDGPQDFVEGWFYDAPLSTLAREDMENWLAWGCFSATWEALVPESRADVMLVLDLIEESMDHRFPARTLGQAPVACMRFSLEPMEWTHKPLMFYAVCQGLLGGLGTLSMWNEGFSKHRSGAFDYWVRMPETEEGRQRTPIVFVHGIGVGLVMYLSFIKALVKHDCPVICVELPFISTTITPKVPSISEQVASMDSICTRWGFKQAMFVGHSYGSVILSWMVHHLPSRVAGLAFVDPVVMMLNLKNILFNFLYKHDGDGKISDLIGTELHINNALRRNFWWYRNIVWASDLQREKLPSLVCLSENDEIVPSCAVERHIAQHSKKMGDDSLVASYMMKSANHGDMLFNPEIMEALSQRIGEHYTRIEATRTSMAVDSVGARFPRSLGNVFGQWEAAVQLKWAARRISANARDVSSRALAKVMKLLPA